MVLKYNFFHLVEMSPWPLLVSFFALNLMAGFVMWFKGGGFFFVFISIFLLFFLSVSWWRDVERESSMLGDHCFSVSVGLKFGMLFFIISEIMFFLSFFWTFVSVSNSSDVELGLDWPPMQMFPFDPLSVSLVNTVVLVSSGASITWCHHLCLKGYYVSSLFSLFLTIFLGVFFSLLQLSEYMLAPFSFFDSVMGSSFFVSTGFHGLHVLIGTTFLLFVFLKRFVMHDTSYQSVGFECSAWYWHFVDVVWLFLYSLVYWWGG